jgi:hypothetical protein
MLRSRSGGLDTTVLRVSGSLVLPVQHQSGVAHGQQQGSAAPNQACIVDLLDERRAQTSVEVIVQNAAFERSKRGI